MRRVTRVAMRGLIGGALVIVGLLALMRFMFTGSVGSNRPQPSRSGGSAGFISPTRVLRGASSRNRYSTRSPAVLWAEFALAMAASAGLVFDSAQIYTGVAHKSSGEPTSFAIVMLFVTVACIMALIDALPASLPRDAFIKWFALLVSIGAALTDPWIGALVQAVVMFIVATNGRRFEPVVSILATLFCYYLIEQHEGSTMLTLTITMTVLIGMLSMLIMVARRTLGLAVVVAALAAILVTTGGLSTL